MSFGGASWRRAAAWAFVAASSCALCPRRAAAEPESEFVGDGRDAYTLFPRHPLNRELFQQLARDDARFRLGRELGRLAFLADVAIGTQQTFDGSAQSRFHGFYLADTYTALRVIDGLEVNLNLLLLNPSASDGYRVSSQLDAGLALHGYLNLFRLGGDPVRADLFGTDLGWVTLGAGLWLEQMPLEGVMGQLSYRDLRLSYTYIGRALWADDDVIATVLSAFGGRLGLMNIAWHKTDLPYGVQAGPGLSSQTSAEYADAYLDLPLREFHFAAEYGARVDRTPRSALLVRSDYLGRPLTWLELHAGYQFRWYEQGAGPRDELNLPTVVFNVPYREDTFVTNSFEYLRDSKYFTQWSHTVMLEARAPLGASLQLFGDGELWLRNARTLSGPRLSLIAADGFHEPGRKLELFGRFGARYFPWAGLPHRASAFVSNKQVQSGLHVGDAIERRFQPGLYYVLELEAYL